MKPQTTPYPAYITAYARDLAGVERPTILVAGCSDGASLEHFLAAGADAYGFDRHAPAIERSSVPDRVVEADVRDPALADILEAAVGIDADPDLVVTEKLISCLSVCEAVDACRRLRELGPLLHRLKPAPAICLPEHTPLSMCNWQAACDPDGVDRWEDAMRVPLRAEIDL